MKRKKPKMTVVASNKELLTTIAKMREFDHAFLSEEGVRMLTEPFGFVGKTSVHKADPDDPKGLTLKDGAKSARGADAVSVAASICNHVGVEYEGKLGRGSQLRACCDALEAHFTALEQKDGK